MKRLFIAFFTLGAFILLLLQCTQHGNIVVTRQITGLETNCYLLYDEASREAALFDVGGPIDSLLAIIDENELVLKYFFFTHGHSDHIIGLPAVRHQFPDALVCIHKNDYDDIFITKEWAMEFFSPEALAEMRKDPEFEKVYQFDPNTFGEPEVFVEDNQIFELGNYQIRTIFSPGHSPGGVCYYVGNMLFSGDVLFYRTVGRTDLLHSSIEDQIHSVRRLYAELPADTKVYPGHGEFTDIGSEKLENEEVTMEKADLN